ncbi:DNA-binding transcriptional regulator, LysR family [Oryzisolibacter propanilivorax]|uniref:DNA-binding transcriptional regulator, LysR family n=1 Tax=Oryzisolibacter propanilivorax TaxID=1527607 RepID=A0A1G9RJJ1_9BURK|nr:LysR family transcriptional regulator [Oryzisolibacter propanilivorax]SDM23472.1 DNA-binding transcriptional regulator, LysR family [Oryzisolibacter propanilivorax]
MGPGNRPLDLQWLEDFLALADSGNFSRAAQARAIAQPAFSRHIRALEDWVGAELFDRSAHPATLTAAGQRFLPLLQEVLTRLEDARTRALEARDQAAVSLRFAVTHLLSMTFFAHWLAHLEGQLRLGPIQTLSDSARACEELLLQRRVQFVLCHARPGVPGRLDEAGHPAHCLGRDLLCPVSAPQPWGADGRALHAIGQADNVPLLAYSEASGLGRIVRARLQALAGQAGAPAGWSEVFTAHHGALLKTMALEGRGIAWLPQSLVAQELQDGRLVPAGPQAWNIEIEVRLYRQGAEMAQVAEQVWQLAQARPA